MAKAADTGGQGTASSAKSAAKKPGPKKGARRGARGGVNKSEEIRVFARANPDLGPTAIANALTAKGVEVSPPQVSNVLTAANKKDKVKGKPGPKPGRRAAAAGGTTISIDSLVDAKRFAEKVGGVDEAKQLISALEKVAD